MQNIDYKKFLQVLQETKGIHNSLNEIFKYDFIYHSNKIEGSTFTTEALQLLFEKNIVQGTHKLVDVQETVNSFYIFDMVIDTLDKKLTLDIIKEWHGSLMYRTSLYDMGLAGVFKKYQNTLKVQGVILIPNLGNMMAAEAEKRRLVFEKIQTLINQF